MFGHDPPCSVCGEEHYPWCPTPKVAKRAKRKEPVRTSPRMKDAIREFRGPTLGDFLDSTIGDKHGVFDDFDEEET